MSRPAQDVKIVFNTCATDHKEVEDVIKATLADLGFRYVGAEGGADGSERHILFDRDLTLKGDDICQIIK